MRPDDLPGPDRDETDVSAPLARVLATLPPAEAARVLQQLVGGTSLPEDLLEASRPPSRRRPRRSEPATYRVRVDLVGTKPPLWRRLELASDLHLDEVHEVLQVAFGWTDSHLHRFASGPQVYGPETEHYLCPFDVGEDDTGVPEEEVRLDEVLVDPGDRLFYLYDYGDGWEHVLRLEAVVPRDDDVPRARCTAGRRDGPAEDCGGVYGHELIAGAADPSHPEHAERALEFARFYGDEVDPASFATTPFDLDRINRALDDLGLEVWGVGGVAVPAPLADLVAAVPAGPERRELRRLIADAALGEPVSIDADTAARMVHPYAWLLERVGDDGIELTAAGYLPPAHVEAAFDALGLEEEWIGKGNREDQTRPVLHLRESAQAMGLLRKHRGRLLRTARGRDLRADPVALWWHLAERMPPASRDVAETQAGLTLLVAVAAQAPDDPDVLVAEVLRAIGWASGDGTSLTPSMGARAASDTRAVLRRIGAMPRGWVVDRPERPTPAGVAFARAALGRWPAGR